MTASASPSSSARAALETLVTRLREMREDSGLTAVALASSVGWRGHTKVSKIEHGARPPSVADINAWCRACGREEETPSLIALLRNAREAYVEWSRLLRGGMVQLQEARISLTERTRRFRIYEPGVVPGLLQTPGYAEAALRLSAAFRGTPITDLTEAVEARMRRQQALTTARTFAFLIEESALRARLGGPAVMGGQLDRLVEVSHRPNVSLGVIPVDADRIMWPTEGFWMYDDAQVSVETATALITVTDPAEIEIYGRTYSHLSQMALVGDPARYLIRGLRSRL